MSTSITPKCPPGLLCHLWLAHGIGPAADLLYSFATVTDLDVSPPPRLLGDGVKFVCTEQALSLFSDSQVGGRGAEASSTCDHQHPCAANSLPRWEVLALGSLLARGPTVNQLGVCERGGAAACPEQQLGSHTGF